MSHSKIMLTTALLLFTTLNFTACNDDDVYRAPEPDNSIVVEVTDIQGSADAGWTVTDLTPGVYDLEFYSKWPGGDAQPYIKAGDKMTSLVMSGDLKKHLVRGVDVSDNGTCNITLYNGKDVKIQNMSLIRMENTRPFTLLKGGDISELSYIESMGGKYYDANDKEGDCMKILADGGMNLARIRLYNDPGNPDYMPSAQLPAGYQNLEDCLALARRAKENGMQIVLSFHYSDFWTNGETQSKPHEWAELDAQGLKDVLYTYTKDVLEKFKAQGTTPEFVAIGNEIQAGMLYPEGSCVNMKDFTEMLNSASKAIREASPESRVVIHTDKGGIMTQAKWFFGEMANYGVDYDIIGASYYPFWTQLSAYDARVWADKVIDMFDKDILFMEAGYAWNPTLPSGYPGQLSNNGPYNDASIPGQRNFIADLSNEIKLVKTGRVLGYVYWDPIMIEVPGVGWVLGGGNVVSNTTLFDFNGKALPVLDAYKFNN